MDEGHGRIGGLPSHRAMPPRMIQGPAEKVLENVFRQVNRLRR